MHVYFNDIDVYNTNIFFYIQHTYIMDCHSTRNFRTMWFVLLKLGVSRKSRRLGCFQKNMVLWIQPAMRLQWRWGLYMSACVFLFFFGIWKHGSAPNFDHSCGPTSEVQIQIQQGVIDHRARPRQDQKKHIWPTDGFC